ncbi:glycoside hydrolase family 127 protein [Litoribacter alkaliphilus]|uniref:Glycoside hydrolase family 127 protein n=1 Tax=Litoribacter ruber TaxID=702568 RepID=A0AAP2CG03_9BACT|nr:glycoside hydrolase family 127 protein [Litoribacter alkaliphilus]MBS9522809.1 glycoside hydrolase family 127 protein [Litoribacter alkaliphilus]
MPSPRTLYSSIVFFYILFYSFSATSQTTELQYFGLDKVKLLDSPFLEAMQVNRSYLMEMDTDRLLSPYMLEAGVEWTADRYGNWENTGLDGHVGGHYLSALAMLYAATGDQEAKERLDYMISNLAIAQQKNGNGYLGGVPGGEKIWEELRERNIDAGTFSLNGKWVPLYNIHKIYAGLRDAYLIAGVPEAKTMLVELTDWFLDLTSSYEERDFQEILISEHGGLNEVFADVAEMTGEQKYLDLAKKMSHHKILFPLAQEEDNLTGMHANTQIPKIIGFQKIAELESNPTYVNASRFFWDNVVNSRSVTIGGNSVREHFHEVDNFAPMLSSEQGPETCNTYNMMRLSEKLFQASPDRKYIDYYERALYNHILSSQHPETGGYVYFTSMRPNHYRVYSQPHNNFWCCVGSGMENHTKYGQVIYAHRPDELFINLFIASELDWKEQGMKIVQDTKFPFEESTTIQLKTDKPKRLSLNIRKPNWLVEEKVELTINGEKQSVEPDPTGYIKLERTWHDGDQVVLSLPMQTTYEKMPDNSNWLSFLHGPIVLAAKTGSDDLTGLFADDSRMGHNASGKLIPLAETEFFKPSLLEKMPEKSNEDFKFLIAEEQTYGNQQPIELIPFFQLHESRYQVYWPVVEEGELDAFKENLLTIDEYLLQLDKITVDFVAAGEQQPESEHEFQGSVTVTGQEDGGFWRSTTNWFEYKLQNKNQEAKKLRISYTKEKVGKPFLIYINDTLLKNELFTPEGTNVTEKDYDISNIQSEELIIRFESIDGFSTEKIKEIRLIRNP